MGPSGMMAEPIGELHLSDYVDIARRRKWILVAAVVACLPVYALSNWSAETWPRIQHRFGFFSAFDGIVISGAVGVKKPDPAIFAIALEAMDAAPEETVYVGDLPSVDVEGARAAGIAPVLGIDNLEFIAGAKCQGGTSLLWTATYPVNSLGRLQGAVGFNSDRKAGRVQ